jgi:hypothetical protein
MKALFAALRRRTADPPPAPPAIAPEDIEALIDELRQVRADTEALATRADATRDLVDELLEIERRRAQDRAAIAAIPHARLRSAAIILRGRPVERLRVNRLTTGEPVERSFSAASGAIQCATDAPDVRALWEQLLAHEREHEDDVLRGQPSTILDIPDASVSAADGALHVVMRPAPDGESVIAVPRFTYSYASRKIYNFGHWLLDCLPQIVALSTVGSAAKYLLPSGLKPFQERTLRMIGVEEPQVVRWDGATVDCRRLLAFETDGRAGGGRPLSALVQLRQVLASRRPATAAPYRRIYFSRRDARRDRRWTNNEPAIEALFQQRGFEIVSVGTHTLEELTRLFAEARIVAGVNGAGLAHILFSPPGTHVVLLFSDSLMRWHAVEGGARSVWAQNPRPTDQLAVLGDSPRVYAHVAAVFNQIAHSFVGGDEMPIDQLGAFLDDVLLRAAQP